MNDFIEKTSDASVSIRCRDRGYLVGFQGGNDAPIFGEVHSALRFNVTDAVDLCFELDDPQPSTVGTVQII